MVPNPADALSQLPTWSRATLCDQYLRLYGTPAPRSFPRKLLLLAVGYRLQEQSLGGLRRRVRSDLLAGRPAAPMNSGTVLVREWHGVHHTVRVLASHVEYRGQKFRSLSAVASLITGCRRSGTAFFSAKPS